MLSLKKLLYIFVIGFAFNCCAMEEDEKGNTRPQNAGVPLPIDIMAAQQVRIQQNMQQNMAAIRNWKEAYIQNRCGSIVQYIPFLGNAVRAGALAESKTAVVKFLAQTKIEHFSTDQISDALENIVKCIPTHSSIKEGFVTVIGGAISALLTVLFTGSKYGEKIINKLGVTRSQASIGTGAFTGGLLGIIAHFLQQK